jgi:hypothetical protein
MRQDGGDKGNDDPGLVDVCLKLSIFNHLRKSIKTVRHARFRRHRGDGVEATLSFAVTKASNLAHIHARKHRRLHARTVSAHECGL